MDLIDRFKYLMKLNNLSPSAFADEIGVQRSSVSHILSARNKPSLEFIQKVLTRFPKVSADWLIAGVTNTEKDVIHPKETTPTPLPSSTTVNSNKEIKKILIFYQDNSFEEFLPNS